MPSIAPSRCRDAARPNRQRGVALLASLAALAIAVVAATAMAYRVHLNMRRTQNVLSAEQAWLYARTAEPAAIALLGMDRENNDIDYAGQGLEEEPWYLEQPFPKQMEDGALLRFAIEDLQGRFNLNNVASGTDAGEAARQQLARLIARSGVRVPVQQLEVAVADWVDADQEQRFPGGAEDDVYTRMNPAYRAANQPMIDATELRLVQGMSGDDGRLLWNALCPVVTAVPALDTPINVNTASPAVLLSLTDQIDESDVATAIEQRLETPYTDVQDFLARNQAFAVPELRTQSLSVSSEYFMVRGQATLGRAVVNLYSVIHRPADGPITVIYRSRTPPEPSPVQAGDENAEPPASCIGGRLAF